ncbi:hypothetical protein GBF38_015674, partial [Nibea albiflora]
GLTSNTHNPFYCCTLLEKLLTGFRGLLLRRVSAVLCRSRGSNMERDEYGHGGMDVYLCGDA